MDLEHDTTPTPATPPSPAPDERSPFVARRVLVPTRMEPADDDAIILGAELAYARNAQLAVLHVGPVEVERSYHWLDALDRLYEVPGANAVSPIPNESDDDRVRRSVHAHVERVIPAAIRPYLSVTVDFRRGEVADAIVRAAANGPTDLIVMGSSLSRKWIPLMSGTVRRVLEQSDCHVILARSGRRAPYTPPVVSTLQPSDAPAVATR